MPYSGDPHHASGGHRFLKRGEPQFSRHDFHSISQFVGVRSWPRVDFVEHCRSRRKAPVSRWREAFVEQALGVDKPSAQPDIVGLSIIVRLASLRPRGGQ